MANYNVKVKIFRGSIGSIEQQVENYLATIDSSKVIRSITSVHYGAGDSIMVILVHDA